MKYIGLLMLAMMLTSNSAVADDTSGFELSAWANYYDVRDGDDNIWGPGIGLGVPLVGKDLLLDVRASWLPNTSDDDFYDLEIVPLDLGLSYHYRPDDNWGFSVMGGVTYAFANYDQKNALLNDIADIKDEWGSYVGLGGEYKFNPNFGAFTNVYYRLLDFNIRRDNPGAGRSGEFDAKGVNVDVGLKYYF